MIWKQYKILTKKPNNKNNKYDINRIDTYQNQTESVTLNEQPAELAVSQK